MKPPKTYVAEFPQCQAVAPAPALQRPVGRPPKTAVLVTHGMGQQQRFDTLVLVAEGLLGQTKSERAPRAARVQLGTEQLARIELNLDPTTGHDVHVYEAYWAPLTEGRVRLSDVTGFLVRAGLSGLFKARREFPRWVLGQVELYPLPLRNLLQLLLTFGIVIALMVINAVIVAVGGSELLPEALRPAWPPAELVATVSRTLNVELAAALLFALTLVPCVGLRHRHLSRVQLIAFSIFALVSLVTAWDMVSVITWGGPPLHESVSACAWASERLAMWATDHPNLQRSLWVGFVGASELVRRLLVEYVGDVAAYVSSHKLDRFEEIRNAIRARVCATASAIYAAKHPDGTFVYDSVAIVGHSLGSVISYDCLNQLLNNDALGRAVPAKPGEGLDVLGRTCLLLTFGSPLDKIAYIFGSRDSNFMVPGRSALAATSQPLILSDEFRRIPWVNVYSPYDVISGALNLFGRPGDDRVYNVRDDRALTWILAHTEYWKNSEVWRQLHAKLVVQEPATEDELKKTG